MSIGGAEIHKIVMKQKVATKSKSHSSSSAKRLAKQRVVMNFNMQ
jgi:hypothetical protein